jgi:hypothetical protein
MRRSHQRRLASRRGFQGTGPRGLQGEIGPLGRSRPRPANQRFSGFEQVLRGW